MNANLVYLVQTDTTVGFSSNNDEKLSNVKKRPVTQKILQTLDSFKSLKTQTRVPNKYKKRVRNSKLSTYIYSNKNSYRVVNKNTEFYDFIKKFKILFSTSANQNKKKYSKDFAYNNADVIVKDIIGFNELKASSMYIITNKQIKKIR